MSPFAIVTKTLIKTINAFPCWCNGLANASNLIIITYYRVEWQREWQGEWRLWLLGFGN